MQEKKINSFKFLFFPGKVSLERVEGEIGVSECISQTRFGNSPKKIVGLT